MSNEKKQEIIDRPDFSIIVMYAIKRYKLAHKLRSYGIDFEQFLHEIRVNIWTLSYKEGISHTTYITNHALWVCMGLSKKKPKFKTTALEAGEYQIPAKNNDAKQLEAKDELENLLGRVDLSTREKTVLNELLKGENLTDAAKNVGLSTQRVSQIRQSVINRIKYSNEYTNHSRTGAA